MPWFLRIWFFAWAGFGAVGTVQHLIDGENPFAAAILGTFTMTAIGLSIFYPKP